MRSTVKSNREIERSSSTADRRLALLVVAFALGWYARTVAPGLLMGDPGEFHFAAWRFGLAHPTGYPLYLMVGGLWQHLLSLFGADPAFALNLLSMIFGALTAGLLYLLMARLLPSGNWGRLSALFVALLFTLNPTFWSQSLIAEVYTLNALLVTAVLWMALRLTASRQTTDDGVTLSTLHPVTLSPLHLLTLSFFFGLAIGHHRTALFLAPGLLLWLFWRDSAWWQRGNLWLAGVFGVLAPQLVYLYIPLRSGPDASPWLYPRLNGEVLALYSEGIDGFVEFITGRVFAVSFLGIDGALARLAQMIEFWLLHFNWTGLVLVAVGLVTLIRGRAWAVLLLTVPFALCLQGFNLFYGIGDIYVFYIPLYLVAAIWAGFGIHQLGQRILAPTKPVTEPTVEPTVEPNDKPTGEPTAESSSTDETTQSATRNSQPASPNAQLGIQFVLFVALIFFVLFPLAQFYDDVDLSGNNVARAMWDAVLAANPPEDSILVSNDRNEIVPLYYLQVVEGRAASVTGIFPLLTPEDRFADVGAVVQTALDAGDRPVYLIKPMDGLGVRFDLASANGPLVQVLGAVDPPTTSRVDETSYGPLTLRAVTMESVEGGSDGEIDVQLYWHVNAPLGADYTTTVQLFDAAGEKIAQSDQPPGFPYYPTSLWKVGDSLREQHRVSLSNDVEPARILVALYRRPPAGDATATEWIYLAEPVTVELR